MSCARLLMVAYLLGIAMLGLNACSTSTPGLDTLTQAEPDATRQRAMRRLSLASAYYEQGQNDVAQQEVRAALQIDSQFADAYSLLGLIHQRDNAALLAQQSFEHAIQLASASSVNSAELSAIQHNYGWFLCQQKRYVEAQFQFERAVSHVNYRQVDKTRKAIELCQVRADFDDKARQTK